MKMSVAADITQAATKHIAELQARIAELEDRLKEIRAYVAPAITETRAGLAMQAAMAIAATCDAALKQK